MKGYTPGLFDRLLGVPGAHGNGAIATRLSIEELKDAVARDLEALLNTRLAIPARALEAYPECGHSILTYGLSDFSNRSLSSPIDRTYICSCLVKAITQHEPRLREVKAMLEMRDGNANQLTFAITAMLVARASEEPVHFDAVLKPSTLQYRISRAGRAILEGG